MQLTCRSWMNRNEKRLSEFILLLRGSYLIRLLMYDCPRSSDWSHLLLTLHVWTFLSVYLRNMSVAEVTLWVTGD